MSNIENANFFTHKSLNLDLSGNTPAGRLEAIEPNPADPSSLKYHFLVNNHSNRTRWFAFQQLSQITTFFAYKIIFADINMQVMSNIN